ncbi:MAG TPA: DUF2232 domain-containing protein [Ktedonobacteraceae bacterium]|nr:DUF2232 domain-containing protein [Ktedonobacteraceae bacterium]
MIKDNQKTEIISFENLQPLPKRAFPAFQPRQLRAIEIAEGALLADIGVIFQLLIKFLPVGGVVLQVLVPVLFAVIVLRRGFYVGCMSLCVALFVVCIVMGPGGAPFLLLEAGAGLFLGLVMRYRLGHFVTVCVGILGGGIALWAVLLFYALVGGGASVLLRSLHQTYASLSSLAGLLLGWVGLGGFWLHQLFPPIDHFMQWGFQHWLFFYYLISCLICIPLVLGVYFVVNFFLRLLGYQVRPFPGYRVEGGFLAFASGCFKLVPRRVLVKFRALYHLKCEVRRLNIARLRRRRLEREASEGV